LVKMVRFFNKIAPFFFVLPIEFRKRTIEQCSRIDYNDMHE
jgi:hypothetical protein